MLHKYALKKLELTIVSVVFPDLDIIKNKAVLNELTKKNIRRFEHYWYKADDTSHMLPALTSGLAFKMALKRPGIPV